MTMQFPALAKRRRKRMGIEHPRLDRSAAEPRATKPFSAPEALNNNMTAHRYCDLLVPLRYTEKPDHFTAHIGPPVDQRGPKAA
jgi:hypothetical protein